MIKILNLLFLSSYFLIAAKDIKHRKIPNLLVLYLLLLAVLQNYDNLKTLVVGFLVCFGLLFLLYRLGATGAGDVKLAGATGAYLGPDLGIIVLLAGSVLAVIYSVAIYTKEGAFADWIKTNYWAAAVGIKPLRTDNRTMPRAVFMFLGVLATNVATWCNLL